RTAAASGALRFMAAQQQGNGGRNAALTRGAALPAAPRPPRRPRLSGARKEGRVRDLQRIGPRGFNDLEPPLGSPSSAPPIFAQAVESAEVAECATRSAETGTPLA